MRSLDSSLMGIGAVFFAVADLTLPFPVCSTVLSCGFIRLIKQRTEAPIWPITKGIILAYVLLHYPHLPFVFAVLDILIAPVGVLFFPEWLMMGAAGRWAVYAAWLIMSETMQLGLVVYVSRH